MKEDDFIPCSLKELPLHMAVVASAEAVRISPTNAAPVEQMMNAAESLSRHTGVRIPLQPEHLAIMTQKFWGTKGVKLSVGFFEQSSPAFYDKVIAYANHWKTKGRANVNFVYTQNVSSADVRITTAPGGGYASYLGTDIMQIPKNEPTMWLERFNLNVRDSEWSRVVEHEFGHTLGCPHEQFLPAIIALLNYEVVIAWGMRQTGWLRQQVINQMLTPLAAGSYRASTNADVNGVMMYPFPASVTKNGQAIPGGVGIDEYDAQFISTVYPLAVEPPKPPDPPVNPGEKMTKEKLIAYLATGAAALTYIVTLINNLPTWLSGLIPAWLKTPVTSISALLTFLATDPKVLGISVLDILVAALNGAGFALPTPPTQEQMVQIQPAAAEAALRALPAPK